MIMNIADLKTKIRNRIAATLERILRKGIEIFEEKARFLFSMVAFMGRCRLWQSPSIRRIKESNWMMISEKDFLP